MEAQVAAVDAVGQGLTVPDELSPRITLPPSSMPVHDAMSGCAELDGAGPPVVAELPAAGELRDAAASELRFLSFLSHDVGNHLSAVTLNLKLLKRRLEGRPEFAPDLAALEQTQQCVAQTSEGMQRVVAFARLRGGGMRPDPRPVDLHRLGTEVAACHAHEAEAKGLALSVEIPRDTVVSSDSTLMRLVLQNLVGNAVKYSRTGAVTLDSRFERGPAGYGCVVSVSDQGPGIPGEYLRRIFEPFERGGDLDQPGSGLGLAIAAEAARLLGAELSVESRAGVGSTFGLRIPAGPPGRPATAATSTSSMMNCRQAEGN